MALVRAYVPVDFFGGTLAQGRVTKATSTQVVVSDGFMTSTFNGVGFTYSGPYVTGGTVTSFVMRYGNDVAIEAAGFSGPAPVVAEHVLRGDLDQVLALALAAGDLIYGSDYGDRLAGFSGDDFIDPGSGNDYVDGGSGTDIVFLEGTLADFEVTFLGNGTFEVADRNLANGTEGTDLLSRVEFVRFGDGSQYALSDLVVTEVWHEIPADVELVAATYQFFTGAIPGAAGFEYLIASTQNPNDLNDSYYAQFNMENRYINFASNLATEGAGRAGFEAVFGGLSFQDTLKVAYLEIMGKELSGAALAFFLSAEEYYRDVAAQRVVRPGVDVDEATKIVAIGSILNEAVKGGTGVYAAALDRFVEDVAPDGWSPLLGGDLFAVA